MAATDDMARYISDRTIKTDGGCWEWQLSTNGSGYGRFWIKVDGEWTRRYSHRASYENAFGPIPSGLVMDHLCKNTLCCNPEHLEVVTQSENVRRGDSHWTRRTHCPSGHEYNEENTRMYRGRRYCRACNNGKREVNKNG